MTFGKWMKAAAYLYLALVIIGIALGLISIGAGLMMFPNTFIFLLGLGIVLLSATAGIYASIKTLLRAYEVFKPKKEEPNVQESDSISSNRGPLA